MTEPDRPFTSFTDEQLEQLLSLVRGGVRRDISDELAYRHPELDPSRPPRGPKPEAE